MAEGPRPGRLERIGRYRILDRIGRGGMAVVYSAHDEVMERDVAVKVMMGDGDVEPAVRARFKREAQVSASLAHRNIVTVFDIGEDDGRLFIVMELLRGQTLAQTLKERRLSLEDKIDLALEICEGLAFANGAGVCHRDVKPANLFLLADGGVKLLDFGIAKPISSSMTATGALIGTPDYMSPEQAKGIPVDERSDIFSLGAVVYFMLSGRAPFNAPSWEGVIRKVKDEDPAPLGPAEAPPALARIVTKALAKPLDDRYQNFRELSADLGRWRRRYEAETRTCAAEVARRLEQLPELVASERDLTAALGVTPECDLERWRGEVAAGHPSLESGGSEALKTGAWTREAVDQIGGRVSAIVAAAEPRMAVLRAAATLMATAAAQLDGGDGPAALSTLERIEQSVPGAAVQARVDKARALIAAQQARENRLRILLEDAAACQAAGQLDRALALASEAVRLDPQNAEARQTLARLEQYRAISGAEKVRRCERALDRARHSIRLEQFDEAERQLGSARETGVAAAQVEAGYAALTGARSAREAADAEMKEVTAELAEARDEFQAGRRAAAVQRLTALTARYPVNTAARAALGRLRTEDQRLTAAEQTLAQAERLGSEAAAALAADSPDSALQLADRALALAPSHESALRTSALARACVRERSEHAGRVERSKRHIAAAREHLQRSRFARALNEGREAVYLDPNSQEAASLVADAVRRQTDAATTELRNQEAAHRANELRELLASAAKALRVNEFARARTLAGHAIALNPDSEEPRALIVAIATAAAAAARNLDDRTVDLDAVRADPEAAVVIARYPDAVRQRARLVRSWMLLLWTGAVVWMRLRLDGSRRSSKAKASPEAGAGRKES